MVSVWVVECLWRWDDGGWTERRAYLSEGAARARAGRIELEDEDVIAMVSRLELQAGPDDIKRLIERLQNER